jgi:hypothetical protein
MPMPKAAMHEYGTTSSAEYDVWAPWKILRM